MGETNDADYENFLHALASRAQCPDTQAWLSVGCGFGRVDMGERGCSDFSQASTCSERGCGPLEIAMTRSKACNDPIAVRASRRLSCDIASATFHVCRTYDIGSSIMLTTSTGRSSTSLRAGRSILTACCLIRSRPRRQTGWPMSSNSAIVPAAAIFDNCVEPELP